MNSTIVTLTIHVLEEELNFYNQKVKEAKEFSLTD